MAAGTGESEGGNDAEEGGEHSRGERWREFGENARENES